MKAGCLLIDFSHEKYQILIFFASIIIT
jgi:hypothetical protein